MIEFDVAYNSTIDKFYILIDYGSRLKFTITCNYKNRSFSILLLNKYTKNILTFDDLETGEKFLKDFFIQNLWDKKFNVIKGGGYLYE